MREVNTEMKYMLLPQIYDATIMERTRQWASQTDNQSDAQFQSLSPRDRSDKNKQPIYDLFCFNQCSFLFSIAK